MEKGNLSDLTFEKPTICPLLVLGGREKKILDAQCSASLVNWWVPRSQKRPYLKIDWRARGKDTQHIDLWLPGVFAQEHPIPILSTQTQSKERKEGREGGKHGHGVLEYATYELAPHGMCAQLDVTFLWGLFICILHVLTFCLHVCLYPMWVPSTLEVTRRR